MEDHILIKERVQITWLHHFKACIYYFLFHKMLALQNLKNAFNI